MKTTDQPLAAPTPDPCWAGEWFRSTSDVEMWTLAALTRTIAALPSLHPWSLADAKGQGRVVLWSATPSSGEGVAVLSQTGVDPNLATGSFEFSENTAAWDLLDSLTSQSNADRPCWIGGLVDLPGSWLPDLALLPRSERDLHDPRTRWSTESVDFADRFTVQAQDQHFAADVLAPHVMAFLLDRLPSNCAATASGNAIHVWAPLTSSTRAHDELARRLVATAAMLREAIPSFVFADHRDHSGTVEDALAQRAAAAAEYRRGRQLGKSADPDLQRIYDRAKATYAGEDVSSGS